MLFSQCRLSTGHGRGNQSFGFLPACFKEQQPAKQTRCCCQFLVADGQEPLGGSVALPGQLARFSNVASADQERSETRQRTRPIGMAVVFRTGKDFECLTSQRFPFNGATEAGEK